MEHVQHQIPVVAQRNMMATIVQIQFVLVYPPIQVPYAIRMEIVQHQIHAHVKPLIQEHNVNSRCVLDIHLMMQRMSVMGMEHVHHLEFVIV